MSDAWGERIDREVDAVAGALSALRRHLHRYPEPSREEFRTAQHLGGLLTEAGIPHREREPGTVTVTGPSKASPQALVSRVAYEVYGNGHAPRLLR